MNKEIQACEQSIEGQQLLISYHRTNIQFVVVMTAALAFFFGVMV